jgi:outer membrane protein assembly factor BamD
MKTAKHLSRIVTSISLILLLSACKSEFEKIRTSGDPELLLQKSLEYYKQEEYQRAQLLFELIMSSYRGRQEGEELFFKYAYTFYHLENFMMANYHFKTFAQTYPLSPQREEADFMAAYAHYQLSPVFRLDQSYSLKAIDDMENFVALYPQSERVAECNRIIDDLRLKLEKKTFEEGKLYFKLQQYQSAVNTFENLLKDFPETSNDEEVRYMIFRSAFLRAENSILERRKERYEEALKICGEFLKRYQKSNYRKELEAAQVQIQQKIKQLNDV